MLLLKKEYVLSGLKRKKDIYTYIYIDDGKSVSYKHRLLSVF